MREHPDAYSARAQVKLQVRTLPEQLASPADEKCLPASPAGTVCVAIRSSRDSGLTADAGTRTHNCRSAADHA